VSISKVNGYGTDGRSSVPGPGNDNVGSEAAGAQN
jgi:hypothetical protein